MSAFEVEGKGPLGNAADFQGLSWKKHFGARCEKCNEGCFVEITAEQWALADPVLILRSLHRDDGVSVASFFARHRAHGAEPVRVELAPMPQS